MNEIEKVEECYRQLYSGMVRKDAGLLSEILGDGFILVHMTGMRQSKSDFIRCILDGTLNYFKVDHESIKVSIEGERAKLKGKSRVEAAVFGGGRNQWRLCMDITLVREKGQWRIRETAVSTY